MFHPVLAFQIDNSLGAFLFDLLFLAIIAVNAYVGYKRGLVRRAVAAAGVFGGLFFAVQAGAAIGSFFLGKSVYSVLWMMISLTIFGIAIAEVLGVLFRERLKSLVLIPFDRIIGTIGGVLLGALECGTLYLLLLGVANVPSSVTVPPGYKVPAETVQQATLGEYIADADSIWQSVLNPVLPSGGSKGMGATVAQGAPNAPKPSSSPS